MTTFSDLPRRLGPFVVRSLAKTWRFRELDATGREGAPRTRLEPAIYALWHADLLSLGLLHGNEGAVVLVSRHRDGEIIANLLEEIGYGTVRGSSSRGGSQALRAMIRAGRAERPLAFTADGPRGPARRCKAGIVLAAMATGLPVIPCAAHAFPAWRLRSWDRFVIPAPGARIRVAYGPPIHIQRSRDPTSTTRWLERIERGLAEAAMRCAEPSSGAEART